MTRLIDADALLEELNAAWEDNVLSTLGDAVSIITNAPTIQREGWVSVPIEPTNEMIYTGAETLTSFSPIDAICIYKAMIQAAPTDKE